MAKLTGTFFDGVFQNRKPHSPDQNLFAGGTIRIFTLMARNIADIREMKTSRKRCFSCHLQSLYGRGGEVLDLIHGMKAGEVNRDIRA